MTPGSPEHAAEARNRPLISPIAIDDLLTANDAWWTEDERLGGLRKALDKGVSELREALREHELAPDESPGAELADAAAAVAALSQAGQGLQQAVQARQAAQQALREAFAAGEQALQGAAEVVLARRAIAVLVVILGALMVADLAPMLNQLVP